MIETTASSPAGIAFDEIAPRYDEVFTRTLIGQAQRRAVWRAAERVFHAGDRLLELNCGTGEDAFFLASMGARVVACDASERMIEVAQQRKATASLELPIDFLRVPIEQVRSLRSLGTFDGVFSNFSGLNCVRDLSAVAQSLATLTRPRARMLICVSSRVCAWETIWYGRQLQFAKAIRRFPGSTTGHVGEHRVRVWYPTVRTLRRHFAPTFTLRGVCAIGLFVPPSYAEPWVRNHTRALRFTEKLDAAVCRVPVLRGLGDHVLLHFERCAA